LPQAQDLNPAPEASTNQMRLHPLNIGSLRRMTKRADVLLQDFSQKMRSLS
jgi:hypothetical protein